TFTRVVATGWPPSIHPRADLTLTRLHGTPSSGVSSARRSAGACRLKALRSPAVFVMKVRLARCREAANELRLALMGPLRREEAAGDRPFVDADIHRVDRQHAGESVLCDPLLSSAKRREHATGEPAVQRRLEDQMPPGISSGFMPAH